MQNELISTHEQKQAELCIHCFQPVGSVDGKFCCSGCETVYNLLNQTGLSDYYRIRTSLGTISKPAPVTLLNGNYGYLDDSESIPAIIDQNGGKTLEFYLDGVHCAACVWLIEKLPDYLQGVTNARLNLSTSTALITITADSHFEEVANLLSKWGYRPHVVQKSAEIEAHAKREQFLMLSRIGVAAFSSGNLMILSVALYAGLQGMLAHYFEWLSFLLALPTLSFAAWPFYKQAWTQIFHSKKLNIDVPIALSLLLGTVGGTYELFLGSKQIYFDSLAMLVFLLLFSRYTLWRTQQHILKQDQLLSFYSTETVLRQDQNAWQSVPISLLRTGDTIEIQAQQRIPVDGIVLSGQSQVDQSVLTGEPFPQTTQIGDQVFCGTYNQQAPIRLSVTATAAETRLGKILSRSKINIEEKTHLVRLADKLARYFVSVVLILAAVLFLALLSQPHEALSRVLALVIVSCPCALALATPLIIQMGIKRALAKGFFVREADSLERLPALKQIVFDKTGTLTQGRFDLLETKNFEHIDVRRAVLALESKSQHPIAHALVQELLSHGIQPLAEVTKFQKLASGGIQGQIEGKLWEIRPDPEFDPLNYVGNAMVKLFILCNGKVRSELVLGDQLRPEAAEIIQKLKSMNYTIWLLSGDQPAVCQHIAQTIGISAEHVLSRQTPEDKEAFFETHTDAIMIGDGINDIMALSKANVGISVQGSAEENLQSSDIFLADKGVLNLPNLLWHAKMMRRLMVYALGFSLIYNVLGITAAILGFISPLAAAVLMPLSALTVFSIAIGGGRILCRS